MFEIDPDIKRARTLPSGFYTDQQVFERSKERIFSRSWYPAAGPEFENTLRPVALWPGLLDEPALLVRNGGKTSCFSNVCTHRGKIIVENECDASLIRCGYHGRRFSLDGKFLSMPEFEGVEGFPSKDDDLPEISVAEWCGFLFASLSPFAPFSSVISDLPEGDLFTFSRPLALASHREYEVDAHWALYCENYLEGFHIPYVHRSLNEVVDYGTYDTELFRYSSIQTGLDSNGAVAGKYLFIFPATMFNFYDWGISVNVVRPASPSRTVVDFLTYLDEGAEIGSGAGGDLHRVEMEDEAVVESVQKGIRSRFYDRGRYSPTREQGTHHFHRLIAEFMG
ncbi:MAG TPA: SRPBCC family protein [Pyrinomonadaceae bacterium]|nr:SRPBCC family protein [Pyrinomonadaceae bacterium]